MFIFHDDENADCYEVYVDGRKVVDWLLADDESNMVDIKEFDWYSLERGERVTIPDENPYGIRFVELTGKVQIKQVKPLPEQQSTESCSVGEIPGYDAYYGCGGPYTPFSIEWDGKKAEQVVKRFMVEHRRWRETSKHW